MGKAKVLMLAVGHSPRHDLIPDLEPLLSDTIEIEERGCLDAYSVAEVKAGFLAGENEEEKVTKLSDGSMVALAADKIVPLMQKEIDRAAADGFDAIVVLCTGKFPVFKSSIPLLLPYKLLHSVVPAIADGMQVAAVFPFAPYGESMAADWKADGINLVWDCITPSADLTGGDVADLFVDKKPELLVLDCIGYTYPVKQEAQEALGIPVIQPKKLIASVLNCLFDA